MATVSMPLPASAWMATSDVTSWASAQAQVKQSSGSVPSPRWIEWLFDASTDEHIVIAFIVPNNFSSAPVLDIFYKCTSATSGTAEWDCAVHCVTDGDSVDVDADAFDTVNSAGAAVPSTAGHLDVITITLTNNDSMTAGDFCTLMLLRDISADSVSADIEFIGADFQYST